jgi:cell cycle sensor histidine kinase DivJ
VTRTGLLLGVLSLAMMPVGIYRFVVGDPSIFLVATLWVLVAAVGTVLQHHGRESASAIGQVLGLQAGGAILSMSNPALADFGLAIAVLGPIQAALLAGSGQRLVSWLAFGAIAGLSILLPVVGFTGFGVQDLGQGIAEGIAFIIAALVVAHAANAINRSYQVYDKTEVAAFRHLLETMQDGVVRFSETGDVIYASAASEGLFGCKRFELTGQSLAARVHVADKPAYLTGFAAANRDGATRTVAVRLRRDEPGAGQRIPRFFWAEVVFSAIPDLEAARYEVVALIRDITERKDHDLAMTDARNSAEEASHAKSRFLAVIGHELRTPLNAVVGFSEMMMHGIGGELAPTHKDYAGLIHQSGKHLLEVVSSLLDMSRIEAGKFEIQPESIAPEALIAPSFTIVEALASERKVRLRTEIDYPLPNIVADERACRQVLINLLSNAIKFSNEGGEVVVSLRRQGQMVNLSVRDRGVGMSATALERAGEPFFQASEGLNRKHEGTGLGLSIVKGLVDLHNGTVRVASEAGVGTTVTVLLPINGPSTKIVDTATSHEQTSEPATIPTPWQDERRKAL